MEQGEIQGLIGPNGAGKSTLFSDSGTTILLVEQNLQLALEFASRGYVLQTGRVTIAGPTTDLLASQEVRLAYLGL